VVLAVKKSEYPKDFIWTHQIKTEIQHQKRQKKESARTNFQKEELQPTCSLAEIADSTISVQCRCAQSAKEKKKTKYVQSQVIDNIR
jgi:hypothetical protein